MKFELSYKYSELDKEPQFGLLIEANAGYENYVRWVWYYLGAHIGTNRQFELYPYSLHSFNYDAIKPKTIKDYKYQNDAKRQAMLIHNAIKRTMLNVPRSKRKK